MITSSPGRRPADQRQLQRRRAVVEPDAVPAPTNTAKAPPNRSTAGPRMNCASSTTASIASLQHRPQRAILGFDVDQRNVHGIWQKAKSFNPEPTATVGTIPIPSPFAPRLETISRTEADSAYPARRHVKRITDRSSRPAPLCAGRLRRRILMRANHTGRHAGHGRSGRHIAASPRRRRRSAAPRRSSLRT